MKKVKRKNWSHGQTTIELLLLLAFSMVALATIYSLYSDQLILAQGSKDASIARSTVQKIVDAANTAYLSGKDSEIKVFVEIPESIDLSNSQIIGRSVILQLENGTDIIGSADVEMVGTFKPLTGKYNIYLRYDGNVVRVEYRDFEFNKQGISAFVSQGGDSLQSFTIRNNSDSAMNFFIDTNFSHSLVTLNIDSSNNNFTLNSGELKTVDFNFETDATAYGNYAGTINVIGEQNDINTLKRLYVSVESYLQISDLMIYPRTISESVSGSHSQDYSICNHSSTSITIDDWIDLNDPGVNFGGDPSVSSVASYDCENFTINFTFDQTGTLDANLTASYNDGNTYTTFMTFDVS